MHHCWVAHKGWGHYCPTRQPLSSRVLGEAPTREACPNLLQLPATKDNARNPNCGCRTPPSPEGAVLNQLLLSLPVVWGGGTDTWGRCTHRGGAKTKAEPQGRCYWERGREIFPCSCTSCRLNPVISLVNPASVEDLSRQVFPQLRPV